MQAFIICAVAVLVLSFLCGSVTLYLLHADRCRWLTFSTPIGFLVYLSLIQIGETYLTYTQHYDDTHLWYILGVSAFVLLMAVIFWRGTVSSFQRIWKFGKLKFVIAVALFAGGIWVFSRTQINFRLDDINYYGLYIPNRISSSTYSFLTYDYQSFYVLQSVLLEITRWAIANWDLPVSFLSLGFILWVPGIITTWLFAFGFTDFLDWLKHRIPSKPVAWTAWIIAGLVVFLDNWYFAYPHFGGTLRRLPIAYVLLLLNGLLYKGEKKWAWLACFAFGGAIAINSSTFFLSMMILYAWAVFSMIQKRKTWLSELLIMMIFPASFACVYQSSLFLIFAGFYAVSLLIILLKKEEIVLKYLNYLGWPLLVLVPVALAAAAYMGYPSQELLSSLGGRTFFTNINSFDMVPDLLKFTLNGTEWSWGWSNVLFWALAAAAGVYSFYKRSWVMALFLITVLTFFNPLVYNVIFGYLTAQAYFRITDIFFNYVTVGEMMVLLCGVFQYKPFRYVFLSLFCTLAVFRCLSFHLDHFVTPGTAADEDYDPEYHASKLDLQVIQDFNDEYLTAYSTCPVKVNADYATNNIDDGRIKVASQIYGAQLFTARRIYNTLEDRYAYVIMDDSEYERVFARRQPGYNLPDADFNRACPLALSNNTDYIILAAQYNWELQDAMWPCAPSVYENGDYRILMMNRRYYEWNVYKEYVPTYDDIDWKGQ